MLETAIRQFAYSHHTFTVSRHFVELSALGFSTAVDPINQAATERQYRTISAQYRPEKFAQFPPLLSMLAACLEHEPTDVLGSLSHRHGIHNHQAGQFFKPYPVCLAMAKMFVHDAKSLVNEQECIRAHEPCVGSRARVIALAQALQEQGINYQHKLHITARDIDTLCVHMAYVQCTLLHIPALICHGNTLRGEVLEDYPEVVVLYAHKACHEARRPVDLDAIWKMLCESLRDLTKIPIISICATAS